LQSSVQEESDKPVKALAAAPQILQVKIIDTKYNENILTGVKISFYIYINYKVILKFKVRMSGETTTLPQVQETFLQVTKI
jgi:hypothetical protein